MFKRILVPIDGSRTSSKGLAEAIKLAKDQTAALCLLHVVDDLMVKESYQSMGYVRTQGEYIEKVLAGLRETGKRVLAKAEAEVQRHGIMPEAVFVESVGRPVADVIIEQARKWRADLIVLGTHGRRGIRRLVMGSDAEGVVRSTRLPVLLIRAPDPSRPRRAKPSRQ